MTTFFSILFILLGINILLLVFSLKNSSHSLKKPMQKLSENTVPKLYPEQYDEEKYKRAV